MNRAENRILFVTGEYPPQTGGVGAYTERLAHALNGAGWKAGVVTSSDVQPIASDSPITVWPMIRRWDWRIWRSIYQLAAQVGAQWVHVQYQTAAYRMNPSINFAVKKWQRAGLHVAWTYHDLLVPYLFPKAGDRIRTYVTQRPAKQADLTIVTNEGDRQQLESIARNLARIPIGSNINANAASAASRESTRKRLGYRYNDKVIGYFGFLNRSKGGTTLIKTLALLREQVPEAKLLMIGERVGASDPTNHAYLLEVESLISKLQLQDAVTWTGSLDDAEVSQALYGVDVLFMPYADGASLRRGTLMAGLAHGCAVVTTHPTSPLPELTDGESLLYVEPDNPQAATDAILRILDDKQLATRLRTGAQVASRQFAWEQIARQHVHLYQSLST